MSQTNSPSSHYDRIGGEAVVRQLVRRFYEIMDELPETYGIRKMHAENLFGAEDKLFKFLSGWLGGPQLFVQEFGQPFLRRRHKACRPPAGVYRRQMNAARRCLGAIRPPPARCRQSSGQAGRETFPERE